MSKWTSSNAVTRTAHSSSSYQSSEGSRCRSPASGRVSRNTTSTKPSTGGETNSPSPCRAAARPVAQLACCPGISSAAITRSGSSQRMASQAISVPRGCGVSGSSESSTGCSGKARHHSGRHWGFASACRFILRSFRTPQTAMAASTAARSNSSAASSVLIPSLPGGVSPRHSTWQRPRAPPGLPALRRLPRRSPPGPLRPPPGCSRSCATPHG